MEEVIFSSDSDSDSVIPSSSTDPTVSSTSTTRNSDTFGSNLSLKKRDAEKSPSSYYEEIVLSNDSSDSSDCLISPPKTSKVSVSKKSSSTVLTDPSVSVASTAHTKHIFRSKLSPNQKRDGEKMASSNYHELLLSSSSSDGLIVPHPKRSKVAVSKKSPPRFKSSSRHTSPALTSTRNTSSNSSAKRFSTVVASKAPSSSRSGRKHQVSSSRMLSSQKQLQTTGTGPFFYSPSGSTRKYQSNGLCFNDNYATHYLMYSEGKGCLVERVIPKSDYFKRVSSSRGQTFCLLAQEDANEPKDYTSNNDQAMQIVNEVLEIDGNDRRVMKNQSSMKDGKVVYRASCLDPNCKFAVKVELYNIPNTTEGVLGMLARDVHTCSKGIPIEKNNTKNSTGDNGTDTSSGTLDTPHLSNSMNLGLYKKLENLYRGSEKADVKYMLFNMINCVKECEHVISNEADVTHFKLDDKEKEFLKMEVSFP